MDRKLSTLCHKLASASREVINCREVNDQLLKDYANEWLSKSKELLLSQSNVSDKTFNHMFDILKYFNKVLMFNGHLAIDENL